MKLRYIIGGAVIILFAVLAIISFDKSQIEYADISKARQSGKVVQIIGTWVKDMESDYDSQNNIFKFYLKDEKNKIARVVYHGSRPNNFEMAINLVVKGHYENGIFHAKEILTKCPSKYESTGKELKGRGA
jgi:cytochrome c-type biogenesis protein CcmE